MRAHTNQRELPKYRLTRLSPIVESPSVANLIVISSPVVIKLNLINASRSTLFTVLINRHRDSRAVEYARGEGVGGATLIDFLVFLFPQTQHEGSLIYV